MKITYDETVDALYIRLVEGPMECRVVRLSDSVALNIGPREQLVGVEVLDAKEVLGFSTPPHVEVTGLTARVVG
jgi:uncharacterized protein YuzE